MSDLRSLNAAEQQSFLTKKGAAFGLTAAQVVDYIIKYGLFVTDLLFNLLEHGRKLGGHPNAPKPTAIGDNLLKQLLIEFLTSHKTDIESWIDTGEGAVFDGLVALIGSKSQVLAALLTQYKATVIADIDPVVAKALDAVISALQGNTPPPPVPAPTSEEPCDI